MSRLSDVDPDDDVAEDDQDERDQPADGEVHGLGKVVVVRADDEVALLDAAVVPKRSILNNITKFTIT